MLTTFHFSSNAANKPSLLWATHSAGAGTSAGSPTCTSTACCRNTPQLLASIKVLAVITGHAVAVIAAHDKSLRLLPDGRQLTGQLAMMLVMVGDTFTGLYPLFGG
jgi:hypothetical protein